MGVSECKGDVVLECIHGLYRKKKKHRTNGLERVQG